MKTIHIFGAGISGCCLANLFANLGYQVILYEKNNFVGGNIYDYKDKNGILIHKYGPHIFHTSNKDVIKFVKKFSKFNNYKHCVLVNINEKFVDLPINFNSIKKLFPDKYKQIINSLKKEFEGKQFVTINELLNSQNENLITFTKYIYQNIYSNYTSKMWGVDISKININTLGRVKIILSNKNNYFPEDSFQGLPEKGYTNFVKNIIKHKNIRLILNSKINIKFKDNYLFIKNKKITDPVFYSGSIDELANYKFGMLPYRSLKINFLNIKTKNFQPASVVNYPSHKTMTRITEYKKMTLQEAKSTTISKEFPEQFVLNKNLRFYPINNKSNLALYNKYKQYFKKYKNLYFIGRLGRYEYIDMDDAISLALKTFNEFK